MQRYSVRHVAADHLVRKESNTDMTGTESLVRLPFSQLKAWIHERRKPYTKTMTRTPRMQTG